MIEIKVSWHLLLLIIALVAGVVWAYSLDDHDTMFGSQRFWGRLVYVIIAIIALAVYGGIFWW